MSVPRWLAWLGALAFCLACWAAIALAGIWAAMMARGWLRP